MSKRPGEPEEVIEPTLDGLGFPFPEPALPEPVPDENLPLAEEEPANEERELENPVVLFVGGGDLMEEVARLALSCGFEAQAAVPDAADAGRLEWMGRVHVVPDFLDLASICEIDRQTFVCVFVDSPVLCEDILSQCLATDARYLGVEGSRENCREILSALKALGAPDAELAAIACPMGLNIGAETVPQKAVAIVAELLGAWSGALKSLRPGLQGLHR